MKERIRSSGVQKTGDARGDCLIVCPLRNFSIEQLRMVVIATGYTLFVTSYSRLQTKVLARFVITYTMHMTTLRKGSSQLRKHQAARMSRRIAVEQRRYAAGMADTRDRQFETC